MWWLGEGGLSAGVGVGGTIHEGRTHEVPWGEGGGIHGILVSQTQTGNCEVKPCVVLCHKTIFLKITGDKVAFKTTDKLNTIRN